MVIMMKLKFLLGILLIVILVNNVEGRTELLNCVSPCTDSDGCTCPSYCVVTGNVDQNVNCGGDVTSCAQENRIYWIRDGECQATCGDFDNEFMIGKGWEKIDYNCYLIEEPKIEEEPEVKEPEIIQKEIKTPEIKKDWFAPTVIVILIGLILWFVFRKKIKKLF